MQEQSFLAEFTGERFSRQKQSDLVLDGIPSPYHGGHIVWILNQWRFCQQYCVSILANLSTGWHIRRSRISTETVNRISFRDLLPRAHVSSGC
jgi:hypothetical protein